MQETASGASHGLPHPKRVQRHQPRSRKAARHHLVERPRRQGHSRKPPDVQIGEVRFARERLESLAEGPWLGMAHSTNGMMQVEARRARRIQRAIAVPPEAQPNLPVLQRPHVFVEAPMRRCVSRRITRLHDPVPMVSAE